MMGFFEKRTSKHEDGFTLVELITVISIVLIIFGLTWVNLTSLPGRASLAADTLNLVSDLKSQQVQAMVGDTNGTGAISDYGIYFETDGYILFRGSTYNPLDSGNFSVKFRSANLGLTENFPLSANHSIVFTKGSGEIAGYQAGFDVITVTDSFSGEVKIIKLNKYGATY